MKLTVYHDGQYWVGVFEEIIHSKLHAYKYVFGAEPQNEEILELIKCKMFSISSDSSPCVEFKEKPDIRVNPKRLAREVAKEMKSAGISTKAHQALQLERERLKVEKKIASRQQKEQIQDEKWEQKRLKAKEKHRGR